MSTITQALGRLDPRNRRKHTHRNTHDKGKQFGSVLQELIKKIQQCNVTINRV